MIVAICMQPFRHAEFISASIEPNKMMVAFYKWTLKQVQGDEKRYINNRAIARGR